MNQTPRDDNHDLTEPNSTAPLPTGGVSSEAATATPEIGARFDSAAVSDASASATHGTADAVDVELLAALTAGAREVNVLTRAQRESLWSRVQSQTQATAELVSASPVGNSSTADTTSQPAPALASARQSRHSTAHTSTTRRFFPSGALGRSVFALAACSAAFAVGVAVWPSSPPAQIDASAQRSARTDAPQQQSAQTDLMQTKIAAPESDTADAGSAALAQDETIPNRKMASCASDNVGHINSCVGSRVQYGTVTTSGDDVDTADAADPDAVVKSSEQSTKVTLVASEPEVQSQVDSVDVWTVHLTFTNAGNTSASFVSEPEVSLDDPTSLAGACTVQSRSWRVADRSYTSAPTLQPSDVTVLTVTSLCPRVGFDRLLRPDTAVTWQVVNGVRNDVVFSDRLY